jgi:transcriptional regulator with XRE-family HTH domain
MPGTRVPRTEQDSTIQGRILSQIPALRKYGGCLAGSTAEGDALVTRMLEQLLEGELELSGGSIRVALFRALHRVWGVVDRQAEVDRPSSSFDRSRLHELFSPIDRAVLILNRLEGLSLSELADETGISVSYLSRLEKGRSVPSFTLLSRLGHVLGVDIGYFVQTEEEAQQVDTELALLLEQSSIPKNVWPEIFNLSIDTRKALLKFMQDASK